MNMSVLVPTYRRPADLRRCLNALSRQLRSPDLVIVVCRPDDVQTQEVLLDVRPDYPLSVVHVCVTGIVAALNAGLAHATGDIISITDDDAAPHSDWLERIERHFKADPKIGGVGGRDFVHGAGGDPEHATVGIISWFGRHVGNHHLGVGAPRDVHTLKGVNMSFRLTAIEDAQFDSRLRGNGAQVHNELAFCLDVRRKGWRLIYDPAVAVDHFPAQRFDEDQRSKHSQLATSNSAFNETVTILDHLPRLARFAYIGWALVIGARDLPGILQTLRLFIKRDRDWVRFPAVVHGRISALRLWYSSGWNSAQNVQV